MPGSTTRDTSTVADSGTRPTQKRLRFSADNTFHIELKRRVDQHMSSNGRRQRDRPEMYLKTAIILTTFVVSYVLLVFVSSNWLQALPLAVLLGLSVAAIGFNIMHDGSHNAYSGIIHLSHPWSKRPVGTSVSGITSTIVF
jgi:linoleoyl-CoA desaturase